MRIAAIGPDDPSDVVFTSGTTGTPKGAVMTHGQTLRVYLDWCDWADLRVGDRYLIVNPFFHIFGYKAGCLASLMRGATIFPVAVFDVGVVLETAERDGSPSSPVRRRSTSRCSIIPTTPSANISSLRLAVYRRGRHPRRARHPPCAGRAAVRAHPHWLRAHRGRHRHGQQAGRRLRAHRDRRSVPWAGFEVRTINESGRTCRWASRARSSCAARP